MGILEKFLMAFEQAAMDENALSGQLKRMEERTSSGVDVNGAPFKPFKRLPKDGRQTPLGRGGSLLIQRAKVSRLTSLDDASLRATIDGEAGIIASYQNRMRQFWGYSEQDRNHVYEDFLSSIKERMR